MIADMNFYFLRHTTPFDGSPDEERRLTPGGHEEAGRLGRFLAGLGVSFDAAYSSPLIRAIETAEDVMKLTNEGGMVPVAPADALRNEASQEDFQQWLNSLPPRDHILLVGHAPKLGERVGALLGMEQPHAFGLSKGGLACVETEDRLSGSLKFLVSPRILPV